MQNISDVLEELTVEKETEFSYLINKTNFSYEAKQVIKFLHNRIIDLERQEKKKKTLQDQKQNVLAKSYFTPEYTSINNNYKIQSNKKLTHTDKKGYITGMSLAEQKAQEFNRK